ncbi:MAG: trehalose-phosphatase [Candidatus Omnitrophica bacterium]|nr:trehalose-phosphatase [Candidatus Omnitrophota bacterium]MDD5546997.1 trehalose-phosphatase [Candidatus Omnitrophota bacterium]
MKYLFNHWGHLKEDLRNSRIILFLDYDGTLTSIADTPDRAVLSKEARDILYELSKNRGCKLAVISGRSLKDIKSVVGLKNIIYSGNHGLEIEGPKLKFESVVPSGFKKIVRKIKLDLLRRLAHIKGVILEDKGCTLSVHYRLVNEDNIHLVKTAFHEAIIYYLVGNKIKINTGKMILEVRPPIEWDKGRSVMWLLARQVFVSGGDPVLPVYIGDDVTDEDAFSALRKKSLTIFVGMPKKSKAKYYLKSHKDVLKFLRMVNGLKKEQEHGRDTESKRIL